MNKALNLSQFKSIRTSILIFSFLTILISCRKDRNIISEKISINSKRVDVKVEQWGQAINGRWIPYLIDKAKRENPNMDAKGITKVLASHILVLNNAKQTYRDTLSAELRSELEKDHQFLGRLYQVNYKEINEGLNKLTVMDGLWERYLEMYNSKTRKLSSTNKTNNRYSTEPGVEITACAIPMIFDFYFIDWRDLPSPDKTSLADVLQRSDPDFSGCRDAALARMGLAFYFMFNQYNPTQDMCTMYTLQIEIYVSEYLSCSLTDDDGQSPPDPWPPGGGSSGGGTPENPNNPPPAPKFHTSSMDSKWPCVSKKILSKLLTMPTYQQMSNPFSTTQRPSVIWDVTAQEWGIGNHSGGLTALDPNSNTGASSIIKLNHFALANSSELMILATVIHESFHAYLNYAKAFEVVPPYISSPSDKNYLQDRTSANSNFTDHYLILTTRFDQFAAMMFDYGGGRYSLADCQRALLFGLKNAGPNATSGQTTMLNLIYNTKLSNLGFTQTDLDTFYSTEVASAPAASRLPQSGC